MNIIDLIGFLIVIYNIITIYHRISYWNDIDNLKNEIDKVKMREMIKHIYPHFKW